MNTLSASTEQAYYKLLTKERDIRCRLAIEEEAVAQIPENSYMLSRFTHSVEFQDGRLKKLRTTYEKERDDIEERYKRSLEKLETNYERDTKEIGAKLEKAKEDLVNEKNRMHQAKKSKAYIKAEHELEFVLKQKEMMLPTQPPSLTPAPESVPQEKPRNVFVEAEEKRALDAVRFQTQLAEKEARDRKKAEEERKEKDKEAFLLAKKLQEEAEEVRRKEKANEAKKIPEHVNPFVPKPYAARDEEEEDDDDSVVGMDDAEFEKEVERRKQEQRKQYNLKKFEPVQPLHDHPALVGNTKQKKSVKKVGFF